MLLLCSSCSKEDAADDPQPQPAPEVKMERLYVSDETTEAEIKAGPQSRAAFADGYKIAWEAGDQVKDNNGKVYDLQQDVAGRWYVELPTAEEYTVYYPADACKSFAADGSSAAFLMPAEQTMQSGTFDKKALCARAVAKRGEKLVFSYLCSVLKVTLKAPTGVKLFRLEISTATLGGEGLTFAGQTQANADGTVSLIPMRGTIGKSVSMKLDESEIAQALPLSPEGVDFYLPIFPTTFSKGFTLTVSLINGSTIVNKEKTGAVGQTAGRGRILAMPALWFD